MMDITQLFQLMQQQMEAQEKVMEMHHQLTKAQEDKLMEMHGQQMEAQEMQKEAQEAMHHQQMEVLVNCLAPALVTLLHPYR